MVGFANTYLCENVIKASGMASQDSLAGFSTLERCISRAGGIRNLYDSGKPALLCSLMGLELARCFPHCYTRELVPWLFDVWSPKFDRWRQFLSSNKIRLIFFQSLEAKEWFSKRLPNTTCEWLPEACDFHLFRAGRKLADRKTDVLEIGRHFPVVHDQITRPLAREGRIHLYQNPGGPLIFDTHQEMVEGLSDSKMVLCFPRSQTHPEDAGNIEVATLRYFESMASGALPVGRCPAELSAMCGYDPVVPLDLARPAEHLAGILGKIEEWQELVDRNLTWVRQHATWELRVSQLLERLRFHGYEPGGVTPSK